MYREVNYQFFICNRKILVAHPKLRRNRQQAYMSICYWCMKSTSSLVVFGQMKIDFQKIIFHIYGCLGRRKILVNENFFSRYNKGTYSNQKKNRFKVESSPTSLRFVLGEGFITRSATLTAACSFRVGVRV